MNSTAKLLVALMMITVALATEGCKKKSTEPAADGDQKAAAKKNEDGSVMGTVGVAAQASRRGPEMLKVKNDFGQLGKLYQLYATEFGKAPRNAEEFRSYIQRDAAQLTQAIQEGKYVVNWGVNHLSSTTVLAYEKDADYNGNRQVLMGDSSIQLMNLEQLQKTWNGQ